MIEIVLVIGIIAFFIFGSDELEWNGIFSKNRFDKSSSKESRNSLSDSSGNKPFWENIFGDPS